MPKQFLRLHLQDMLICHMEDFGRMNWWQIMTSDISWTTKWQLLWQPLNPMDDLEDNGEDLLMTLSTTGENLLMTHDDDTDDHCANNVLWSH